METRAVSGSEEQTLENIDRLVTDSRSNLVESLPLSKIITTPDALKVLANRKRYGEYIENRMAEIEARIDYPALLHDIEKLPSGTISPAATLIDTLLTTNAAVDSVPVIVENLKNIVPINKPPQQVISTIAESYRSLKRLESLSAAYLLPESPDYQQDIPPADEIYQHDKELIDLIQAERDYRLLTQTSNNGEYLETPKLLWRFSSFDFQKVSRNPNLAIALNNFLVQKREDLLPPESVFVDDLVVDAQFEEKVRFLENLSLYAPLASAKNSDEAAVLQGVARRTFLRNSREIQPYTINKLYRLGKGIETPLVKEFIDIDHAREILRDEHHALEIYIRESVHTDPILGDYISEWFHSTEKKEPYKVSTQEIIHAATVLEKALTEHSGTNILTEKKDGIRFGAPCDFSAIESNPDYAYFTKDTLFRMIWEQEVIMFSPLRSLLSEIVILPERDNNAKTDTIWNIPTPESLAFSEMFIGDQIRYILAHETGEAIVQQLPYKKIKEYCDIFYREAERIPQHPAITSYAYAVFAGTNGDAPPDPAMGITEDFCDAVALFLGSITTHKSLFATSPERYWFIVGIIRETIPPVSQPEYNEFIERMVNEFNFALKPIEIWTTDTKTHTGGELTTGKGLHRIKEALGIHAVEKNNLHKNVIVLHVPGLHCTF